MNEKFNPEMLTLACDFRGMTQTELARQSGVPQGSISKYESSVQDIRPEHLRLLAEALDFPEEFFYRDGEVKAVESASVFHLKRKTIPAKAVSKVDAAVNLLRLYIERLFNAADAEPGLVMPQYRPAEFKNDIEFILMERKPGGYRSPSLATRILSVIPADQHKSWFRQIWTGLTGASTKLHPAPYPLQLAERLIRMFSFVGDTVLDPFMGTGTTNIAAAKWGRNSIGVEVDPHYFDMAAKRLDTETPKLIARREIRFHQ
jgi:transcriptional regulator with XRE-family HTH domain